MNIHLRKFSLISHPIPLFKSESACKDSKNNRDKRIFIYFSPCPTVHTDHILDAPFQCIKRVNILIYKQIHFPIFEHIAQILRTEPRLALLISSGSYRSERQILKNSNLRSFLLVGFLLIKKNYTELSFS